MAQPGHLCSSTRSRAPARLRIVDAGPGPARAPASWPLWRASLPAATDAVRYLQRRFGLDLWLVTHVAMDAQTVLASAGPWASTIPPGAVLPWSASFCRRMAAGQGPSVAPDVRAVPAYARVAQGLPADVRSYLGVPILDADSHLIGTLCAVSGTCRSTDLSEALEPARLIGRMLSTVLAGEAQAGTRSEEAAPAYGAAHRAERRRTGLGATTGTA